MNMIAWIVLVTTIANVGGTGLGGLVGVALRRNSGRAVSLLLSFAGGVMVSVVCFDLIESALFPDGASEQTDIFLVIAGILAGYLIVLALNYIIDRSANRKPKRREPGLPRSADDLGRVIHADRYEAVERINSSSYQLFIGGVVMACAIALHNLPEGIVIGASFASGANSLQAYTGSGLAMAVVIGLHDVPEGMAVSVPLVSGGMSRGKAAAITALTGVPTVFGALAGYCIGMIGPMALALSLSLASGAMLYVVFGELLPDSALMWHSKLPAFAALIGVIVGLLIIRA